MLRIPNIEVNNQCNGNTFTAECFLEDQLKDNKVTVDVIKLLIDKKATVREGYNKMNLAIKDLCVLNQTSLGTQLAKLAFLLQKFPTEVNQQDGAGDTVLHIAVLDVHENNITAIERLKAKHADWEVKNKKGTSPRDAAEAAIELFCKKKKIQYKAITGSGPAWELYKKFKQACGL